jgi:hypothetical protein
MSSRFITIIGAATGAALGAWVTSWFRSRSPRQELGLTAGLPAAGQCPSFEIEDDRAAEIIQQFAPVLDEITREAIV